MTSEAMTLRKRLEYVRTATVDDLMKLPSDQFGVYRGAVVGQIKRIDNKLAEPVSAAGWVEWAVRAVQAKTHLLTTLARMDHARRLRVLVRLLRELDNYEFLESSDQKLRDCIAAAERVVRDKA